MGLLDELEQEAARRNSDAAGEAERQAREKRWKDEVQPAAVRLGEYLSRFAKTLAAAERRIRLNYSIAGYGEVVAFGEAPFDCRIVPGAAQHEIEFAFAAQASPGDCSLVVADTPSKVRFISGVLQNHHLSGLHDVAKNASGEVISGRFQARGRIPVKLHALASAESGHMKISVSNVEAFGILTSTWTAEALTDEAFDRIGRYLLRDLATLTREKVDANTKRQLQSQIQRDQIKREWEAKLSVQLQEDEAKVIALMSPTASPRAFVTRAWSAVERVLRRGG
jgi:hypothetical protein